MIAPHIIFPVGPSGSSPVIAAARTRLFALSTFIYEQVGENPSACWYPIRTQYVQGPSCFVLDIGGSSGVFSITLLPSHETRLPALADLGQKQRSRTLILPVADATDAFFLSLFLLDNLAAKPVLDPDAILVPRAIRHGLGVFSCR